MQKLSSTDKSGNPLDLKEKVNHLPGQHHDTALVQKETAPLFPLI